MQAPETRPATDVPPVAKAYNGVDRNTFLFGWNPQAELWNGRLAMIGFLTLGYGWIQCSA